MHESRRHRRVGIHRPQRAAARAARVGRSYAVYHSTPGLEAFVAAARADATSRPVRCDLLNEADVQALARDDWRHAGRDAVSRRQRRSGGVVRAAALGSRIEHASRFVTCLEHCPADHVVYRVVRRGLRRLEWRRCRRRSPVSPRLPYAISKLASEQYLRFFCRAPRHVSELRQRALLRRLRSVRSRRARSPRGGCRRWRPASASSSIRGDGKNLIDFMYVDDAVDGFLALVKARGAAADGGLCVGRAGQRQRRGAHDGARRLAWT